MEHFSALLCFLHFKDKQEKRNERGLILILFKFFFSEFGTFSFELVYVTR